MADEKPDRQWKKTKCGFCGVVAKLLAGCLLILVSAWGGISFLFCVEIKSLFDLNQTQVEILNGMYIMGIFFVLPYAVLHRKFGFYVAFVVASALTLAGFLVMALCAMMSETFRGMAVVLYIILFTFTNGRCGIYFLVSMTALLTTPKAHKGKAVGLTGTMMFFGEMIASPVYKAHFADTTKTARYFLLCFGMLVSALVIYVIVYIITGRPEASSGDEQVLLDKSYQPGYNSARTSQNHLSDTNSDSVTPGELELTKESGSDSMKVETNVVGFKEMFRSCNFHLYLWSGAVILSSNMLYFTNVCLLLQSLRMQEYQNSAVITMMSAVVVFHLSSGFLYDAFANVSSKVFLMIGVALCNILSFCTLLVCMNNIVVLFVSLILMSSTMGGGLSIYLTFSVNLFGPQNLGMVQGALLTCYEIFGLIFSIVCGVIYDYFTSEQNTATDHICYGIECYWWTWLITLCSSVVVAALPVILWYRIRQEESRSVKLGINH